MDNKSNENQINVELTDQVAEGTYSNLAIITHSPSEFVIDFARIMPGMPKAPVKSRIILTPEHALRLLFALQENIHRYEAAHGAIRGEEATLTEIPVAPVGFRGPTGQA